MHVFIYYNVRLRETNLFLVKAYNIHVCFRI